MSDHTDDELEDYESLVPDLDALVDRRIDKSSRQNSSYDGKRPGAYPGGDVVSDGVRGEAGAGYGRHPSTHMKLERTKEKGRYILTADDPEVQEILKMGKAREAAMSSQSRSRLRTLVFTRQFTTFDRQNPLSADSPFHGFFTLFWIAMVLMFCQVSASNWRQYGSILGTNEVMKLMFSRDVVILGLTDLIMLASTSIGLILQKLILHDYLKWATSGWIIQNIWQTVFLAAIVGWIYYRDWPWTHTIFMVLHTMVYLMKQHSYAFYNGHLSGVYRRREMLQRKLHQLQAKRASTMDNPTGPNGTTTSSEHIPTIDLSMQRNRPSMADRTSTNLSVESSDVARVAKAIESGQPLNVEQTKAFERVMLSEIEGLDTELKGKNVSGQNAYPRNLNLRNFVDWTCLPTVVYELDYPRQDFINWWYVAEKTAATFGTIGVMMVISQAYIYPAVARSVRMKEAGVPLQQRMIELPWLVSDMLFPLLLEQLLSWYVIWECILNVLAEVTCFADRGFYGPWWNSSGWEMYARDWNRPVHNFLLRHVYHSSISTFHLSKSSATFVTFLLSALVHELVMACLFKKLRGYLFLTQLLQLPMVAFSRTRFMKGRDVLGNAMFWAGLFIGPSVISACYLLI